MAEAKPTFAAIPARAIGDAKLSALDIRVLAAIAAHERFSRNGVGCTAGHGRLAGLVGCHLKSLSRSIAMLAERGYLGAKANPINPKSRAYFVIYTDFDAAYLKSVSGNHPVTHAGSEMVTSNGISGNQLVPKNDAIGNHLSEISEQNQEDATYNIFSEAVRDPVETENRFSETAPRRKNDASVAAMLAMIERGIKAGKIGKNPTWLRFLETTVQDLNPPDENYGRALRLLETYGDKLEGTAA